MSGDVVRLAATSLNLWAMDFQGNYEKIRESVVQSKLAGARYRFGSELEITGYACADHFFEPDTELHSWEVIAKLMDDRELHDVIIDVGMPVTHRHARYNCRVLLLNASIVGIFPKNNLCNDGGNYREYRFFVPWTRLGQCEDFTLPRVVSSVNGQTSTKIGSMLLKTLDTVVGIEVCESLWTNDGPGSKLTLHGAEIIVNSSSSHFKLKKDWPRRLLTKTASYKSGCLYALCNPHGCDGDRLLFDGETLFALNGEIIAFGEMFSLKDVQVLTCAVDLHDIRAYRSSIMSNMHSATALQTSQSFAHVSVDFSLSAGEAAAAAVPSVLPVEPPMLSAEEEISRAAALWLWDYLRRSGMGGFFLPLSGGIDSCSVACIVGFMCQHLVEEVDAGNERVLADIRSVVGDPEFQPKHRKQLAQELLHTCYMGTKNSSDFTRKCAEEVAAGVGSSHSHIVIDAVVQAVVSVFSHATSFVPRFRAHGGSRLENIALQNIQARLRMVLAYLFAQLILLVRRGREKQLLVLGSGNVDEALRGYLTKYDCSSADINPIGGISKTDLRKFIQYTGKVLQIAVLQTIYESPPTAELEPLKDGQIQQTDEQDMGMTYEELSLYGRLRKMGQCGPYSMYLKLIQSWRHLSRMEVAGKVKHFFRSYAINRHKQTVLTPAVHMENYSPDDNRFDLRQFLYNVNWRWQFAAIDSHAAQHSNSD